jgi:hypothetical protein
MMEMMNSSSKDRYLKGLMVTRWSQCTTTMKVICNSNCLLPVNQLHVYMAGSMASKYFFTSKPWYCIYLLCILKRHYCSFCAGIMKWKFSQLSQFLYGFLKIQTLRKYQKCWKLRILVYMQKFILLRSPLKKIFFQHKNVKIQYFGKYGH